ncbi:chloride channel protein [Isoptericola sp. NEAU-Y5]|uniref:Chloride channel protein n=1 Tax=Isoptericola luteus TaxID=2879484 RepID=A0ABS7ZG67_9MICO|nr:chloride channel protein [Isoptericola sp. NEAU-Y5]MCA5894017.1 chloride channel protein [Isoptericola sp. NEAU-Y5]
MTDPTEDGTRPATMPAGRGLLRLLGLSAALGVPVSLASFAFLALLHEATGLVWEDLPSAWGLAEVPWWWPLPWLAVGGVVAGLAIRALPGHGGHVPVDGLSLGPVPASYLPGILLAALAGLPVGAVLGPEAPLLALGAGLALVLVRPWDASLDDPARQVLAVAGSAAALSAIFGSPLVGAVFVVEAAAISGLAGARLTTVVLPALLTAGIGALVFTGMGIWTGLGIASLALPELDAPVRPDLADLLWTVPLAVVVAVGVRLVHRLGAAVARRASARPFAGAVAGALAVAVCASGYALVTGRSPMEVALSGQELLGPLASDPTAWGAGALVALLAFKAVAYGVSLGTLRGGPIFPAVLLGAAAGVLVAPLPGYGMVPALAAGMAAATAATLPFPVSSAVLVVLLLGSSAPAMAPTVLLAVVVGYVTEQYLLRPRREARAARERRPA